MDLNNCFGHDLKTNKHMGCSNIFTDRNSMFRRKGKLRKEKGQNKLIRGKNIMKIWI